MATTAEAHAGFEAAQTKAPEREAYAEHRCLLPLPESIRFDQHCRRGAEKRPALVAAVVVPATGEFRAIHRTFVNPDGRGKASDLPRHEQKMSLGPTSGAAVVLGSLKSCLSVFEGEGIETVWSASTSFGQPGIATLSAGTLGRPRLPPEVRVVILADRGSEADAERGAARRKAEGRRVFMALPPEGCKDFNRETAASRRSEPASWLPASSTRPTWPCLLEASV